MFESAELEAAADAVSEALADVAGALADVAGALADVAGALAEDVELDELHAASARQLTVAATARNGLKERMCMRNMPPEDRLTTGCAT
jgi:hypothetical protein